MSKISKFNWEALLNKIKNNNLECNKLDFNHAELDDNDIKELVAALETNTTIKSIDLSWNKISATGAESLAKSKNNLVDINLSFNFIGNGANFLLENTNFRKLDLSFNKIRPDGVKSCPKNSILTWLSLRSNQIGPQGAKYISDNKSIQYLDICSNHIGDEGAKYLSNNRRITTLNVACNEISDEGALMIARRMYILQELFLGNNSTITEISKEAFRDNAPKKQVGIPSLTSLCLFAVKTMFPLDERKFDRLPTDLIELIQKPEIKVTF